MSNRLDLVSKIPLGHEMRRFWMLEDGMHYLNHGSYGATPCHVLNAQDEWRSKLERNPVRFMDQELPIALRRAAGELAMFLGTSSDRLAFVESTTSGVNAVLRSMTWHAGEEIVIADHGHRSIRNAVHFVANYYGLKMVDAHIPFPITDPQEIVSAYLAAITPRTKLMIVDHIFSALSFVTPLTELVSHCKRLGIRVLVDGAHAPGVLPLALDQLGVDWYAGNCHKWLFTAKGCAFLYASPDASSELHPAIVSKFYGQGFPAEFDWQGTRDFGTWLSVTAALDFIKAIGVARYRNYLTEQVTAATALLNQHWGVTAPGPQESFAAMITLPFNVALRKENHASLEEATYWHDLLWHQHRIEVPIFPLDGRLWLRISAQVYNDISDILALATAITPKL